MFLNCRAAICSRFLLKMKLGLLFLFSHFVPFFSHKDHQKWPVRPSSRVPIQPGVPGRGKRLFGTVCIACSVAIHHHTLEPGPSLHRLAPKQSIKQTCKQQAMKNFPPWAIFRFFVLRPLRKFSFPQGQKSVIYVAQPMARTYWPAKHHERTKNTNTHART